jgi:Fe-S-cluster containining protein
VAIRPEEAGFRPKLRAEVEIGPAPGAPERLGLHDPIAGRWVSLPGETRGVVERLDGTRSLADLAREAGADLVESTVRKLLLLCLIEGAGTATIERLRALAAGTAPPRFLFLEEGRFGCAGSGDCCRSYIFGPITDADAARIAALDVAAAFPELAGEPLFEERSFQGKTARFLRAKGERCIFLRPDARCGLHAAFGAEAKPAVCRIYPYAFLSTVEGIKIFDIGECGRYATTARQGLPVAQDLERIVSLLPGLPPVYHPGVLIDDRTALDYGWFLELGRAACGLIARRRGTPAATLAAVGRLTRRLFDAVRSCPLGPGEPEASVARALAADDDGLFHAAAPAEVETGAAAFARLASAVRRSFSATAQDGRSLAHDLVADRDARELAPILRCVEAVAAARAGPGAPALAPHHAALARFPTGGDEIDALFRMSFRQQLFGDRAMIDERPLAGLLRLGLAFLATLFGARLRAHQDGAARLRPTDFDFGHKLANRVFRRPRIAATFTAVEAAAGWAALEALPAIAGEAF